MTKDEAIDVVKEECCDPCGVRACATCRVGKAIKRCLDDATDLSAKSYSREILEHLYRKSNI